MSVKGKNLSYEAQEPSFLRKLRAQNSGLDSDRHERPIARPRRAARDQDDDDDGPTYVDEASNQTLSKEEYESMLAGNLDADAQSGSGNNESGVKSADGDSTEPKKNDTVAEPRKVQEVLEVGKSQKKRKAARVVAGDEAETEETSKTEIKPAANKKIKKKTKSVKLSFGNEQEEGD